MALSYFGGKNRMSEWIYDFIPKDINTFAEPFSGAMWVYFNTKLDYTHIPHIRYNDYNKHMVNMYSCFQDYHKMIKVISDSLLKGILSTHARNPEDYKQFYKDLYYDFKNNPNNTFFDDMDFNIPDYEVAMKYAFLLTSAFNACHPTKAGFSGLSKASKVHPLGNLKINSVLNKLKDKRYQKKFDNITSFENLDFQEFVEKYDAPDTFYYLDPPYYSEDDRRADWYGVKDTFGQDAHKRLADVLATTEARWALSYYDYPELSEWYPKDKYVWANKEFFRSSASFSENKNIKGNELLIFNYDPEVETKNINIVKVANEGDKPKSDGEIDDFWLT